jgi:hypothetical protein
MSRRAAVRITTNFQRNLEDVRRFLEETASSSAFPELLGLLFDEVFPSL